MLYVHPVRKPYSYEGSWNSEFTLAIGQPCVSYFSAHAAISFASFMAHFIISFVPAKLDSNENK